MDMTMTSKDNTATGGASTHHPQQQKQEGRARTMKERNMKRAHQQARGDRARLPPPQLDEALRCPRCHSSNTKFCYYNNYNMSQPRYTCRACRRYWTHGGTLRNVPLGGGCRKNKRRSSSSSSSSINEQQHLVPSSSSVEQEFPNVLPTMFMPTDFAVSRSHLPYAPLSLSSLAPAPPLPSGAGPTTIASFLDMLLDHQVNNFYGLMSSGMETPAFGFGAVIQHEVVGDHVDGTTPIGGQGGQRRGTQQAGANLQ